MTTLPTKANFRTRKWRISTIFYASSRVKGAGTERDHGVIDEKPGAALACALKLRHSIPMSESVSPRSIAFGTLAVSAGKEAGK